MGLRRADKQLCKQDLHPLCHSMELPDVSRRVKKARIKIEYPSFAQGVTLYILCSCTACSPPSLLSIQQRTSDSVNPACVILHPPVPACDLSVHGPAISVWNFRFDKFPEQDQ